MIMKTTAKLYRKSIIKSQQKLEIQNFRNQNLKTLALENYKILNDRNPEFMRNNFAKREVSKGRKNNLEIQNQNTDKYGDISSIRSLGRHIWNSLPEEIRNE